MIKSLPPLWQAFLKAETDKAYFADLQNSLLKAYASKTIYPPASLIYNAFELCSPQQVKVVLIGQDPYHGPGQANGLSFSVNDGVKLPPSLKNIFKELKRDLPHFEFPLTGNLEGWAKQGVLLLNAVLSVEAALPGSHKSFGWEGFTDAVIKQLSDQKTHLVFLLWGNYARSKASLIDKNKHLILEAAHPSPLARGAFFGSAPFSRTNKYLIEKGLEPVNWELTSG